MSNVSKSAEGFRSRSTLTQFTYLPRAIRLAWSAAPRWTLAWAVLLVLQGLLPAASVYLTKLLVDSLIAAVAEDGTWQDWRSTLILAGLMATILILTEISKSISAWIRTAQAEYIQDHIKQIIHAKSTMIDLAFYESPEYYDHLYRVQNDAGGRPLALLESSGSLLQNFVSLLAIGSLLLPYGFWLPLALLVSTAPAVIVVFHFNRRYHRWWEETTADRRWTNYFDTMLTNKTPAAEIRLFNLGDHFQNAYQRLRRSLRSDRLKLTRDQGLARLGAGLFALVVAGGTLAWMGWQAWLGLATVGDLALFYQAFNRGQTMLQSLLTNVGQMYKNSLFLGNLFDFLAIEPQLIDAPQTTDMPQYLQKGIRFRQVSFRYPGTERAILQSFDFNIPAGQTVAIVGANGAGKTTLLKLLCRFYDPENGRIELDGIDIRHLPLHQLRRFITGLFQNPMPYYATAAHNIALGDLEAPALTNHIEKAARGAGAHDFIAGLPNGYNTLLGRIFADGAELSGGEWQRIALARAFFRQAQIIILDEPTSFMDSWAEMAWLDRFQELVQDKTAVIITHRFTTAMQADIIHVMEKGNIIESGSHAQLLARNGHYARSWRAQMQTKPHSDIGGTPGGNHQFAKKQAS